MCASKTKTVLTPCRQVGLSRKRATPLLKTVDAVLNSPKEVSNSTLNSAESLNNSISKIKTPKTEDSQGSCRQVGLSRSKKTPQSKGKHKSSRSEKSSKHQVTIKAEVHPAPVNNKENSKRSAKKSSKRLLDKYDKDDINLKEKKLKLSSDKDLEETDVKKSFQESNEIVNDINLSQDIDLPIICDKSKKIERNFLEIDEQTKDCDLVDDTKSKIIDISLNHKENPKKDDLVVNQISNFSEITENQNDVLVLGKKILTVEKNTNEHKNLCDEDDDFVLKSLESRKKLKLKTKSDSAIPKSKTKLNLKQTLSVNDDKLGRNNSVTSEELSNCFIKLSRIENKLPKLEITPFDNLSDDDIFTSTPQESLKSRLNNLNEEVANRRKELDELKRAKLYKKMHNVEDLKKLTDVWKTGAKLALNDLLNHLNQHSVIEMSALLAKLNIPEEFLKK